MLRPSIILPETSFYPIGNTPAVHLTQNLPPEASHAKIMLAGCGDTRNILYTIYNESGDRSLDFICCDVETLILARNIILFSLIVDAEVSNALWDIYFHTSIRASSLELLGRQAMKLVKCASNETTWKCSPYGSFMSFCNRDTLDRVRRVWSKWSPLNLSEEERLARETSISEATERARAHKEEYRGNNFDATIVRSLAPGSSGGFRSTRALDDLYDRTGSLDSTDIDLLPNPTFAVGAERPLTLHYNNNPLLGFHLATAANVLASDSPLRPTHDSVTEHLSHTNSHILKAAQAEFFHWIEKFANFPKQHLHIRFVLADALAVGHTLQHISATPGTTTANWPMHSWTFRKLDIELIGWPFNDPVPSVEFDVIDTSNLCDYLGFLNLICAYLPLLSPRITSMLCTETLNSALTVGDQPHLSGLLKGDFDTICLLLGMVNIESWTNATLEMEVDETHIGDKGHSSGRQRLFWKLAASLNQTIPNSWVHPHDLVKVVFNLYDNLFNQEDVLSQIQQAKLHPSSDAPQTPLAMYNRASLVTILKRIKNVIVTDWTAFFDLFLAEVSHSKFTVVGVMSELELWVQLHLQGIFAPQMLIEPMELVITALSRTSLEDIKSMPPVICVTIEVPAQHIKYIGDCSGKGMGLPALCCRIINNEACWSHIFASVQACFGRVQSVTSGSGKLMEIEIDELPVDWSGSTPLVVSAYVPAFTLLSQPTGTNVSINFGPTVFTMARNRELGPRLSLYEVAVNSPNVHLSEFLPQTGMMSLINSREALAECNTVDRDPLLTQLLLGDDQKSLARAQRRVMIEGSLQASLIDRSNSVIVTQISPLTLRIDIGKHRGPLVQFPRPVSGKRSHLRIARKSGYIEINAPFMVATDLDMPQSWLFPASLSRFPYQTVTASPVVWNMPTINPDIMPRLNNNAEDTLPWVRPYVSRMLSNRELAIVQSYNKAPSLLTHSLEQRADFKHSLSIILTLATNKISFRSQKIRIFALCESDTKLTHLLLFVSNILLDLNNRTLALDAAVVPLPTKSRARQDLEMIWPIVDASTVEGINVSKQEMVVWKSVLPAFVERCRSWSHQPERCEYQKGDIPLPSGLGDDKPTICSCGRGVLPESFAQHKDFKPFSNMMKQYGTRVVLAPIFAVPFVEACSGILEPVPQRDSASGASEYAENAGSCAICGVKTTEDSEEYDKPLLKCARCLKVSYCSKACQKRHWKSEHKLVCGTTV